jgi:hypothetical protein
MVENSSRDGMKKEIEAVENRSRDGMENRGKGVE